MVVEVAWLETGAMGSEWYSCALWQCVTLGVRERFFLLQHIKLHLNPGRQLCTLSHDSLMRECNVLLPSAALHI